jgi:MFS family permease
MLTNEFGVSVNLASALYSLPFLISAGISPFLGICIDKIGQRAMLILTSSVLIVVACLITMLLIAQDFPEDSTNWTFLIPLILLGFAYSIYAGALWSSVPYVVKPNTLGTAFGLCTAI